MSKKVKESLADKIAGLLSAAPESFDPEENVDEETIAKVAEHDGDEHSEEETLLSSFRKQNIDLLEDLDSKYAGRTVSRKDLRDSDEDSSEVETEDGKIEAEESGTDEESSIEITGSEQDEACDSESRSYEESEGNESDGNFKHFTDTDVNKHLSKGVCVQNQLAIWESLLEVRIQLQKCLITSNKMPQFELHKEFRESSQDFSKKVKETKQTLVSTLNKMLDLQQTFIKNYPETKTVLAAKKVASANEHADNDDEEIPSDTEEEEVEEIPVKKLKYSELQEGIATLHDAYKPFRNSTIQKWNDKTRIAAGKRSAGTHSVLSQIEHSLSYRQKLINRTQTKRTEYDILGVEDQVERSTEIFDDDDFYHQLLRELIEVKTADLTDPVQLGRQWLQLQNLRSKMKRKIDTKATKGRKIRYTVHSKLVNFMAPIDEYAWTDEAKTELYGSLFGKSQVAT